MEVAYNLGQALDWCEIFKEVGVGDLARRPFTFVGRVVNHRGVPFAFVSGVGRHGAAVVD